MDETQRRKISAKEFIEKNRTLGYGVACVFISLFVIYFAFVYFYSRERMIAAEQTSGPTEDSTGFFESLLPIFNISSGTTTEEYINGFGNSDISGGIEGDSQANDNTKIIKVEEKPILGYTVFNKPISIKNYIQNKPKNCTEKLEIELTKEAKSPAVVTLQNMLKSIVEYQDIPQTGILDTETRDKLYLFQKEYAEILYKKKEDKNPTRLIDKETAHFLNLLCNFENENPDDFVQVPTLRYVLKESREIFDYNTVSHDKTGVDAKVATGTEDVTFSKDGQFAVYRKDINGTIDTVFYSIRTKSVTHLENNITTLDFNDKNTLIYGIPGFQGMTIKSYDYLTNKTSRLATLPLNDWNIYSVSNTEIGINSKPSAFADGIFMSLNTETKKLRQLAGPLLGLSLQKTTVPDFTILSTGGRGTVNTLLLNNKTRNIGNFGIKTFAEKCSQTIFSDGIFCAVPKNLSTEFIYPDDWYKGKVRTEDIIVFKTLSGTSTRVISYLENRPISIVSLNVTENGVFFIDENTLSLYSLEI